MSTVVLQNQTPYEMLYNKPPAYDELKVFGCLNFASNPANPTDKFDHRGVPCNFLGYPPLTKGYKLMNILTNQEFISRDVVFNEEVFPYHPDCSAKYMKPVPPLMPVIDDSLTYPETDIHVESPLRDDYNSTSTVDESSTENDSSDESPPHSPVLRKSTRPHVTPGWLKDFVTPKNPISNFVVTSPTSSFCCFMTTLQKTNDPISFKEAVQHDNWVSAMNEELEALELNQTWEIMQLPPGKHIIGCKWIYRTKYKPDGSVDKYKARLVILGCNQKPGEEFSETFAPVAKLTTVKTLLAVASMQNWHTIHMDVRNAFLHGDLQENVYMKMPQGYAAIGNRISVNMELPTSKSTLVCKLKKSLYGLRQAPRQWFSKLSLTLLQMEYKQSKADPSLFSYHTSDSITLVLIYVDDLLICGSSLNSIDSLK